MIQAYLERLLGKRVRLSLAPTVTHQDLSLRRGDGWSPQEICPEDWEETAQTFDYWSSKKALPWLSQQMTLCEEAKGQRVGKELTAVLLPSVALFGVAALPCVASPFPAGYQER